MALPDIHIFYHIWFKWVDPLVLACSVYALMFTPQTVIDAFIPPSLSVYNPGQGFLIHQLTALFAFVAITRGGGRLAREPGYPGVSRCGGSSSPGAVLLVDVAMLASVYASLEQQDRLRLDAMCAADWGSMLFTALDMAVRVFLLGAGVRDERENRKLQ